MTEIATIEEIRVLKRFPREAKPTCVHFGVFRAPYYVIARGYFDDSLTDTEMLAAGGNRALAQINRAIVNNPAAFH
ncbi:hypothetical protein M2322_000838 [Rhodoblastus acidophilus]|uniref:hypothetical protein n=1 Tax=Rhodoblastus acidophilus TaxID=1074 RepID=UPI0022251D5F|nr:hypothetical protein [Rhodoblastus acidophilus]MCW2315304.1 hypothetical protein [Rhodoblastus acidophilus]